MSDTPGSTESPSRVIPETRARQGRYGKHMMWVLLGGTFLVIAAFAALLAYRAGDFAGANANNGPASVHARDPNIAKSEAQAFHAPEPAPVNAPAGTDSTRPRP